MSNVKGEVAALMALATSPNENELKAALLKVGEDRVGRATAG